MLVYFHWSTVILTWLLWWLPIYNSAHVLLRYFITIISYVWLYSTVDAVNTDTKHVIAICKDSHLNKDTNCWIEWCFGAYNLAFRIICEAWHFEGVLYSAQTLNLLSSEWLFRIQLANDPLLLQPELPTIINSAKSNHRRPY